MSSVFGFVFFFEVVFESTFHPCLPMENIAHFPSGFFFNCVALQVAMSTTLWIHIYGGKKNKLTCFLIYLYETKEKVGKNNLVSLN